MSTSACSPNQLLPPEIWEKIFLSLLSLDDLLRTSTVCSEFRRLIRNKRYLKKYFRGRSTVTKDLGLLCNFTTEIAVSTGDYLYNSIDNDTNQPRTKVQGVHPQIQLVDSRPCLTFPAGSSTYMDRRCKFNGNDLFTISFWFLFRNTSNHVECPLAFIFGHGQRHFLSVNFELTPSGQLYLLLDIRYERRDDIIIAQQLQMNQWYHIVAIFSLTESSIKFYLNGNQTNEVAVVARIDPNGTVLVRSHYKDGCLSDIALWSRKLLPMEIRSIFNQKTSVDKVDMVKYILNTNENENATTATAVS